MKCMEQGGIVCEPFTKPLIVVTSDTHAKPPPFMSNFMGPTQRYSKALITDIFLCDRIRDLHKFRIGHPVSERPVRNFDLMMRKRSKERRVQANTIGGFMTRVLQFLVTGVSIDLDPRP